MNTGPASGSGLVVDVGGTRIRFAVARPNSPGVMLDRVADRRADDYPNFYAALADYLAGIRDVWPERVAIAVAAPVIGEEVVLTNRDDPEPYATAKKIAALYR